MNIMELLRIFPASDRPGMILAGLGPDLWFISLPDAKAYARHALRLTGGRVEFRDGFGNVVDRFDISPAEDDGLRFF